jgi:hypothetical protein
MGAFGNYPNPKKEQIDFDKLKVVPVRAIFSSEGKMRPTHFGFIDSEGLQHTIKIDAIKSFTNKGNIISYCCFCTNYGRQHEVILDYYVRESRWVLR